MTRQTRPKPTRMTICDLCDEEIPEIAHASEKGSLTWGYIAYPVEPQTRWAWLIWPPSERKRLRRARDPIVREEHFDFHAECIYRLVKEATSPTIAEGGAT